MRYNALHIVVFCRSQWFSNVLKGHLRARLKKSLPWRPRPAAVHVKVCYGLFQLSRAVWNVFQIAAKHCKTLPNSAHGRAGMDFMKKIQKVWMNMNAAPFLSDAGTFFSWRFVRFLAPVMWNNAATWYQMVPAYYSILKAVFQMRLYEIASFGFIWRSSTYSWNGKRKMMERSFTMFVSQTSDLVS